MKTQNAIQTLLEAAREDDEKREAVVKMLEAVLDCHAKTRALVEEALAMVAGKRPTRRPRRSGTGATRDEIREVLEVCREQAAPGADEAKLRAAVEAELKRRGKKLSGFAVHWRAVVAS